MALVFASAVEAAAPRYILVSGPGLARPVLLANWGENGTLLAALVTAPRARGLVVRDLGKRPRLLLGLFWQVAEEPRPTRPSQANQKGWFYPIWRSQPAVIDLLVNGVRFPRIAPIRVLNILSRHGVPTVAGFPPPAEPPKRCKPDEVETLVVRFIDAFNRGDLKGLGAVFAREPDFEWYSTDAPGERLRARAYDRSSLVPYFAGRHARGERLVLRAFRFNGNSTTPYGTFEYSLIRRADDLEPTRYAGKGGSFCYRTRPDVIFVWSMSRT
jgi:hypothetical protein